MAWVEFVEDNGESCELTGQQHDAAAVGNGKDANVGRHGHFAVGQERRGMPRSALLFCQGL